MSIGKIIFGLILLAIIPTHWFLGGLVFSALTGMSALLVFGLWLILLIGGISLIINGLAGK